MKKTILAAVAALFVAGAAVAQERPTFIVSGAYQGARFANRDNSKMHSGFRAGVAADFAISGSDFATLSIQPGVFYSVKGTAYKTGGENVSAGAKTTLGYVEVPVLFNARFGVADSFNCFVNVGPYLAYGVTSKTTLDGKFFGLENKTEKDLSLFKKGDGGKKSALNPFDYGLEIGAGVEFSRFQIGVGYDLGLAKLQNYDILKDEKKNTNSAFFVSAGYRF